MLEQLKTLMHQQTRGAPSEFVYTLTPEVRSAILLDLRYVLRDTVRARQLPLLLMLVQTVERNNTRIRFPAEVLARLAREIVSIRDKLPAQSPLIELANGAQHHLGDGALVQPGHAQPGAGAGGAGGNNGGAGSASGAGGGGSGAGGASGGGGDDGNGGNKKNGSGMRAGAPRPVRNRIVTPPPAPEAQPAPAAPAAAEQRLSAGEEAQNLRRAADRVEVNYVTTVELGDSALAGYLTYCLSLGEYDKIIETLQSRVATQPCVWAWNLLVTAMRLSSHAGFAEHATQYHAYLNEHHPETIADAGAQDQRRFDMEKIAALERKELGES